MEHDEQVRALIVHLSSEHLITDDLSAVTKVGRIMSAAQTLFSEDTDRDFIQIVQDAFINKQIETGMDDNQARQSWKTASGGNYEVYLRNHLNQTINSEGLVAIKGSGAEGLQGLSENSTRIKALIDFLTLPAKRRCVQTSVDVWPDNDILILARTENNSLRALASISAKTSSHSRNTSVLFWALAVRDLGIKYFLATQDRDGNFEGDCEGQNVRQERRLFEAYCDRVFTSNPRAGYCFQVKSLIPRIDGTSDLTDELIELRKQTFGRSFVPRPLTLTDIEQY